MHELIGRLAESRDIYLDSLRDAGEDEAVWRPGENCWSVLECAEHVANVEFRIFRTLQKSPSIPTQAPNPERENRIFEQVSSRAGRLAAPELVRPVGRYATLAEAVESFAGLRESAIDFLRACERDLRAIGAQHPILGPCNGYEYALIMAAHPIRHAAQICEIRNAWRAR